MSSGGWTVVRGGAPGASARVLDAEAVGGAVAETLAALTAAEMLRSAPPPPAEGAPPAPAAAAAAVVDEVHYARAEDASPEAPLRRLAGESGAHNEKHRDDDDADSEPQQLLSAADLPAEERVAALHPPPPVDTPEATPEDRVPPVRRCARARRFPHSVPTR